jgi:hypothetical protein
MEVHRLRSVIDSIIAEHARLCIDQKLGHVLQALGACVSNPCCGSDERFRGALTDLVTALRRSRTNDFTESQRRILVEIRGETFTGNGLAQRVLDIANARPYLVSLAREACVEIADDLQSYLGACAAAQAALHKLNVGPLPRGEGAWELGVLLPETVVHTDLQGLLSRLDEWGAVLGDLLSAICPQPAPVMLRDYSAGRFDLAVTLDAPSAAALAAAIAGTYELFRRVRANRERVADLQRQNYPPDITDRLGAHEQEIIATGLKGIREELSRHVQPRRREADRVLDRWLQFLVAQIQDGIEVEVLGPSILDAAPPEEQGAVTHHVRAALRALRAAGRDDQEERTAPAETPAEAGERAAQMSLERILRGKQEAA